LINQPSKFTEIRTFLEDRARQGDPIFYNDLAKRFQLPPVTEAWFSHPLCELFGTFDREDHEKGRPFRTALVVSRDKGIPGEGFFKTLNALRGTPYPIRDELKKIKLWKEEFDRLVSFYK
jgi:hypothetical protein